MDIDDLCQNTAEDLDGYMDDDGCPDPDNDGDGIEDRDDSCPNNAEDFDGFQDSDGCPDVDNDGDGILDKDDRCVDSAEVFNGYQDEDGCPDELPEPIYVEPEPERKVVRPTPPPTPPVRRYTGPGSFTLQSENTFESNSSQIKSFSFAELDNIISELKKYPSTRWRIEVYTDGRATPADASRLTKEQGITGFKIHCGWIRSLKSYSQ